MKAFWRIVDLIVGGFSFTPARSRRFDPVRFGLDIDNYKTLPWFVAYGWHLFALAGNLLRSRAHLPLLYREDCRF